LPSPNYSAIKASLFPKGQRQNPNFKASKKTLNDFNNHKPASFEDFQSFLCEEKRWFMNSVWFEKICESLILVLIIASLLSKLTTNIQNCSVLLLLFSLVVSLTTKFLQINS